MKHARLDYDRIQDPAGLIPENEPVFLIRGQDRAAPKAIRAYAMYAEDAGADPELVKVCINWAETVEKWQRENGSKPADL